MRRTYTAISFLVVTIIIVTASLWFTNRLVTHLSQEEKKRMELWAEATKRLITAEEGTDIEFISTIIEQNTTIPVIMVDADGNYLLSRNVREPKKHIGQFYQKKIADLQRTHQPIEVRFNNTIQYIYYEDSTLLRQLQFFPIIQFVIIFTFLIVCLYTLYWILRSEQNRVWIGLSKETAHQLGTPISSLLGWQELLMVTYPRDKLIPEMSKDIERLQIVAERFSKVGSEPELSQTELLPVLQDIVQYMQLRTSARITFIINCSEQVSAPINKPLFEWVIENLVKNAVDAMEGVGQITINAKTIKRNRTQQLLHSRNVIIDITDTGKGIPGRNKNRVFTPGYTTKKRGWGLGLSLTKRIIEQYHKGKIFVLQSEINKGTTFRIELKNK